MFRGRPYAYKEGAMRFTPARIAMAFTNLLTEAGETYKVVSGSKFYTVLSPDKPIQSGQTIEIHMQQKN